MGFEKGSKERALFADYYKLCEKYWEPTREELSNKNDAFWNGFMSDVDGFANKYSTGEDKFAVHLAGLVASRISDMVAHKLPLCAIGDGSRALVTALIDKRVGDS